MRKVRTKPQRHANTEQIDEDYLEDRHIDDNAEDAKFIPQLCEEIASFLDINDLSNLVSFQFSHNDD